MNRSREELLFIASLVVLAVVVAIAATRLAVAELRQWGLVGAEVPR